MLNVVTTSNVIKDIHVIFAYIWLYKIYINIVTINIFVVSNHHDLTQYLLIELLIEFILSISMYT